MGIEIERERSEIILLHQLLQRQLLQRFNMEDCNPVSTPMVSGVDLPKIRESENDLPYRSLIGTLLFIAETTTSDISYAVAKLSHFLNAYNDEHWHAAKRTLRYQKGTMDMGSRYKNTGR